MFFCLLYLFFEFLDFGFFDVFTCRFWALKTAGANGHTTVCDGLAEHVLGSEDGPPNPRSAMHLVSVIALVPVRASNLAAVSSYEGFKLRLSVSHTHDAPRCSDSVGTLGEPPTWQPCRAMKVLSFAYTRCTSLQ